MKNLQRLSIFLCLFGLAALLVAGCSEDGQKSDPKNNFADQRAAKKAARQSQSPAATP